jgi:hypothetical protein
MAIARSNYVEREEAEEENLSRKYCISGVILKYYIELGQTEHSNIRIMCIDMCKCCSCDSEPVMQISTHCP